MLFRGQALRSVDAKGVAKTQQETAGLLIPQPTPLDVGDLAALVPNPEMRGVMGQHLKHVAIVADIAALTIDVTPDAPEEAHPVTGRDG